MDGGQASSIDLDAYLRRIGHDAEVAPTAAVLDALHLTHATHIPFENLDIQLGRPIRLDLNSLQAKLIHGRRGGYCFEQNTLFAAALQEIGFPVTCLLARVRLGSGRPTGRCHMVLRVEADGRSYLADVGFGETGLLQPVPLEAGPVSQQFGWAYRLAREPGTWVLQALQGDAWQDQYAFTLEPQHGVDFEISNWYTSTHPDSPFVRTLTAQRITPQARYTLRNRYLTTTAGGGTTGRTVADDEELLQVLSETFGLHFPAGTRFRCLQGEASPAEK
jgi:N-hydroxyarylamine O-acetyltransferase